MRFAIPAVSLFCCVLALGCSRESAYRAVVRDQTAAYEEMTGILRTVKDEESMAAAKERMEQKEREFDAIAARAKGLGKLPTELQERLRDEAAAMALAFTRYQREVQRIRALPGGAAFLENLKFQQGTR